MREPDAGSSMKYMWIVYTLDAEILTLWLSTAERGWGGGEEEIIRVKVRWMDR